MMDGVTYPIHSSSPQALNENTGNAMQFPIVAGSTMKKMVSSATLSPKVNFNHTEVIGDLQTPDINLNDGFNFSYGYGKMVIAQDESVLPDLNPIARERSPISNLTMPALPNIKYERASAQCEDFGSNRNLFSSENLDLDASLLNFDFDEDIDSSFNQLPDGDDENCLQNVNDEIVNYDGKCLQNFNDEISLNDDNIAQAAVQSGSLFDSDDFNMMEFLFRNNGLSAENVGLDNTHHLESFENLAYPQFSGVPGEPDLTCNNILEQAVEQTAVFKEELCENDKNKLIDSFINNESNHGISSYQSNYNFSQNQDFKPNLHQNPNISCHIPEFPSVSQTCDTFAPESRASKIIVINNGFPITISYPDVAQPTEFEPAISLPNIQTKRSHEIPKKIVIKSIDCSKAASKRQRKISYKSSTSVNRVIENVDEITLNPQDEITLNSQDDWEDGSSEEERIKNEEEMSREDYANLSAADKYYRMRKQNNKASKKCRENKKVNEKKDLIVLNHLEEENGNLNKEYKELLRNVQSMKQWIKYGQSKS